MVKEERFNTYNFVMQYSGNAMATDSLCDLVEAEDLLKRQLKLMKGKSPTIAARLEAVSKRIRVLRRK